MHLNFKTYSHDRLALNPCPLRFAQLVLQLRGEPAQGGVGCSPTLHGRLRNWCSQVGPEPPDLQRLWATEHLRLFKTRWPFEVSPGARAISIGVPGAAFPYGRSGDKQEGLPSPIRAKGDLHFVFSGTARRPHKPPAFVA